MKMILAAVTLILFIITGCRPAKEINVELVSAQLIRIDTIFRNTDHPKQQLTWRDKDSIEYISIVSMSQSYPRGVVIDMLRQR